MARLFELKEYKDIRGSLCVLEKILPFEVKRIYWIYDVRQQRGGHRHKVTTQAMICLNGSCAVYIRKGQKESEFELTKPSQMILLDPDDWHVMRNFSKNAV